MDLSGIRIFGSVVGNAFVDARRLVRRFALRAAGRRISSTRQQTAQGGASPKGDGKRTIFVDLSVIRTNDAGTGIQRVVRALALAMSDQPPAEWHIQFVAATRKRGYRHISWPHSRPDDLTTFMRGRPGDVFLGLDYSLDAVRRHWRQLARFRRTEGQVWFLVHDLLPVQQPRWFSSRMVRRYRAWLDILSVLANGFLCNSAQTEADLVDELTRNYRQSLCRRFVVLPMGHDILEALHCSPPDGNSGSGDVFAAGRYCLTVGTIEPRKGHADLVDAFETLWSRDCDQRLIFVGRVGWHVEDFRQRILTHREYGRRLIWLDDVGDLELVEAYRLAEGVIIGSHAEGFGLPLIEALGHGRPVLARDLPVFRLHEERGVRFFPRDAEPMDLANCIRDWLSDIREGGIEILAPSVSWNDSARLLMDALTLSKSDDSILRLA
jgi:glycosyltransferase involved in cell wall biosynthesis